MTFNVSRSEQRIILSASIENEEKNETKVLSDLSNDELGVVLTFLNSQDRESMIVLNLEWKERLFNTSEIKKTQVVLLNNMINFISNNLDHFKYGDVIAQCQELLTHIPVLNTNSLLEVKKSLVTARNLVVYFLKSVDEEDLIELVVKHDPKKVPEFFKQLPALVQLSTMSDEAEKFKNKEDVTSKLTRIVKEYCLLGITSEAVKLMERNQKDSYVNDEIYYTIALTFAQQGKLTETFEQAKKIDYPTLYLHALKDISEKFTELEKYDEAIATIKLMSPTALHNDELRKLADLYQWHNNAKIELTQILIEKKQLNKAFEIAKLISNFRRSHFMINLAKAFLENGDIDSADKAIEEAPLDYSKTQEAAQHNSVICEIQAEIFKRSKKRDFEG